MDAKKDRTGITVKKLSLKSDEDLITIRKYARNLAQRMGFSQNDCTMIATALSEICRNAIDYAGEGCVEIEVIHELGNMIITVSDHGPGIGNIEQAMQEGFSTGDGLGIGLPGAKRIMDTFEIQKKSDNGTIVTMSKSISNLR